MPEAEPRRRLSRADRREQILAAATSAFARSGGFTQTGLDDVAEAAGVTRMILYRHFDSKTDLYQAVIDRAAVRLHEASTVDGEIDEATIPGMLTWAAAEPDAFRLLFHHAAREPEFSADIANLRAAMVAKLRPHLPDGDRWADWAASLATTLVIEGIMAWLDAGMPDPALATDRILRAAEGVFGAIATD